MRIGIVGGGASGVLTTIHLLRRVSGPAAVTPRDPLEVVLIDPDRPGRGVAYGTQDPRHLLNVRAAGMSALPADPDHFRAWAGAGADDYLPRVRYAQYLEQLLEESARSSGASLRHVCARVVDLKPTAAGCELRLDDGELMSVGAVVLATGNAPARCPESITVTEAARELLHAYPWDLPAPAEAAHTLVLGSGLTAVDVAVSRLSDHEDTRVTMVSRHGLLPQPHDEPWIAANLEAAVTPEEIRVGLPMHEVLHRVRRGTGAWRQRVDALRPVTQQLWQAMSLDDKRQFLRHAERYWEVHRHRVPPIVARQLQKWRSDGRLEVVKMDVASVSTRVGSAGPTVNHVAMSDGRGRDVSGDEWVVATGPASPVAGSPLLSTLVQRGVVAPDVMALGLAMDPDSARAFDQSGKAHKSIYVIGPTTKGVLWEATAVPDIRVAASRLADALVP